MAQLNGFYSNLGFFILGLCCMYLVYHKFPPNLQIVGQPEPPVLSSRHGVRSSLPQTPGVPLWITDADRVHSCVNGDVIGKDALIYIDNLINSKLCAQSPGFEPFPVQVPSDLAMAPFTNTSHLPRSGATEPADRRQDQFQQVFDRFLWGRGDGSAVFQHSGGGSSLHFAQEAMATLHSVVSQIRALTGRTTVSLLDVPCGDMQWMSRFLQTRDDVNYTGMDIVPTLIERHKKVYAKRSAWRFVHQDIVTANSLASYDLVFSRMMMQHLFNRDVLTMLNTVSQSGSGFLLMTTFSNVHQNPNLPSGAGGRFHTINMELAPFLLPPPICLQWDGFARRAINTNYLGLWSLPLHQVSHERCGTVQPGDLGGGRIVYACVPWAGQGQ